MINWGIIGCGDVTEVKSGPAFNKVSDSKLVAVMRRNADKAADYARRHQVPKWYADADQLINDPDVNAIYIATPPSSHMKYALDVINVRKSVYLEKPMSLDFITASTIASAARNANIKLTVAHYRRQWPMFQKLKEMLEQEIIGDIKLVNLHLYKLPPTAAELANEKIAWRFDPEIAGGGLFHDLAPHQLDILYFLFGPVRDIACIASNQGGYYKADDIVSGHMQFANGIIFNGSWCFTASKDSDHCEIIGSKGTISFSFFTSNSIELQLNAETTHFDFDRLQHVQQPMIAQTVNYFAGVTSNPCSGEEGAEVMRWIEEMTKDYNALPALQQ